MSIATSELATRPSASWSRAVVTGLVAFLCALGLVFTASMPAHAAGMKTVAGNIVCKAYPNVTIGTSATARGSVAFQLNTLNNASQAYYVNLGYSSAYAPWSWKFWSNQAGNFYAYGLGSVGNVTSISRWCHNISA